MKQNNNIENQFKQKLNQRNIEPSEKAWDRLDAMLSVSEQKKPKRNWLWIAASLLVFVSIGSMFLKNEKTVIHPNEQIVTTENNLIEIQNKESIESLSDIQKEENTIVISDEFKTENKILTDSFKKETKTSIIEQNFIEEQTEIVQNTTESSENKKPSNTYLTAQDLLESVDSEKKSDNLVSEQNIKPRVTVNHKSLLYQAEYEVESNYSKNAIDRLLQKGYNNVNVALSKKNQK